MHTIKSRVRQFLVSEEGPTATEYAVMLALILLACLISVRVFGEQLHDLFVHIDNEVPSEP